MFFSLVIQGYTLKCTASKHNIEGQESCVGQHGDAVFLFYSPTVPPIGRCPGLLLPRGRSRAPPPQSPRLPGLPDVRGLEPGVLRPRSHAHQLIGGHAGGGHLCRLGGGVRLATAEAPGGSPVDCRLQGATKACGTASGDTELGLLLQRHVSVLCRSCRWAHPQGNGKGGLRAIKVKYE